MQRLCAAFLLSYSPFTIFCNSLSARSLDWAHKILRAHLWGTYTVYTIRLPGESPWQWLWLEGRAPAGAACPPRSCRSRWPAGCRLAVATWSPSPVPGTNFQEQVVTHRIRISSYIENRIPDVRLRWKPDTEYPATLKTGYRISGFTENRRPDNRLFFSFAVPMYSNWFTKVCRSFFVILTSSHKFLDVCHIADPNPNCFVGSEFLTRIW